jgi:glycosyltransferase involved in cell wall biosynthesis
MKKKYLLIARELTEGGAAFLLTRHVNKLVGTDTEIDILITGAYAPSMLGRLPVQVRVHLVEETTSSKHTTVLSAREQMLAYFSEVLSKTYDCVVGTSLFPDMDACCVFTLSNASCKLLILLDEGLILQKKESELAFAMRGTLIACDHLIPVSLGLLNTLKAHYPQIGLIPYTVIVPPLEEHLQRGIDPFTTIQSDQLPRVVTTARLSVEKQLHLSIHIHRQLRDAGIDFHWYVLGEGPERKDLERRIKKARMQDRFHLVGFIENPRDWMRHADLFVLNSRSEGCPTVLLESLVEGTPVVSTDVNGARELIRDEQTGVICSDAGESLRVALERLLTDHDFRYELRYHISKNLGYNVGDESDKLIACMSVPKRRRSAPEVTILIPTYNQSSYIEKAINSALMQDYESVEVIVCDDASYDDTELLAAKYLGDPRFRYVKRATRLGRVANYRMGLETDASGRWVLMLDGDDHLVDPSFIRKAMEALEAHAASNPLFIQAGQRVMRFSSLGSNKADTHCLDILPDIKDPVQVMSGGDYCMFVFKTGFFTHLGTLYSRKEALKIGFYTQDISSSDMESLLRLALQGNILIMKTIAGAWIHHGNNTSTNLPIHRILENVRIFRSIAHDGVERGKLVLSTLDKTLTKYEARTISHLFGNTVGKSSTRLSDAFRMVAIMFRVNPKLLLEIQLLKSWIRMTKKLFFMSVRRTLSKWYQRIKRLRMKS